MANGQCFFEFLFENQTLLEKFQQKLILVVRRTIIEHIHHSTPSKFFYQKLSKIIRNAQKTNFRSDIQKMFVFVSNESFATSIQGSAFALHNFHNFKTKVKENSHMHYRLRAKVHSFINIHTLPR